MPLELLKIYNARNLKEYTLTPHPIYNILYGANGVGKTTILESVYLLLRSKTFRSSKYKSFINHESNNCTVFSKFSYADEGQSASDISSNNSFTLGISRSKDSPQPVLHLNSTKVNSLSTVTSLVILGLVTPESFYLLDSGPSIRRKFIDWGVFHVEPDFLSEWKSYKKILSGRNVLLKNLAQKYKRSISSIPKSDLDNLLCWSPQLSLLNTKLHNLRLNQVQNINSSFKKYLANFSRTLSCDIQLKYYQGWSSDLSYDEYLENKLQDDLVAGFTRYGTHRGEIRIIHNNNPAKDTLSRGQKKIVVICLILAQFSFLVKEVKSVNHSLLLLDDIDSELDEKNLEILFHILNDIQTQVMITTTNKNRFSFLDNELCNVFHVKQ